MAPVRELNLRLQQFGHWFVLGKGKHTQHGQFWVCQCQCNGQAEIHGDALVDGRALSCGCDQRDRRGRRNNNGRDFTGQQFGKWLAMKRAEAAVGGKRQDHRKYHRLCICWNTSVGRIGNPQSLYGSQCTACQHRAHCKVVAHRWYGNLFTLSRTGTSKDGDTLWRCRCYCTRICESVWGKSLRSGGSTSCQCRGQAPLISKTFGRLYVEDFAESKNGSRMVRCTCSCGNPGPVFIRIAEITSGHTRSCGCLKREASSAKLRTYQMNRKDLDVAWWNSLPVGPSVESAEQTP